MILPYRLECPAHQQAFMAKVFYRTHSLHPPWMIHEQYHCPLGITLSDALYIRCACHGGSLAAAPCNNNSMAPIHSVIQNWCFIGTLYKLPATTLTGLKARPSKGTRVVYSTQYHQSLTGYSSLICYERLIGILLVYHATP